MKLQAALLCLCAGLLAGAGCGREADRPLRPDTALVAGEGGLAAFFDCLDVKDATLVSAHRGGPFRGYPENAIATFDHTLAAGPALLEVDVRRTRDGVLVLLHDDELDRATTCSGRVSERTAEEVVACRLKDRDGRVTAFTPPPLMQVLAWAEGRTVLQLDAKPDVPFEHLVHDVREAGAYDRVVVVTYSLGAAAALARVDDRVLMSVTVRSVDDLDELRRRGVSLDRVLAWTGNEAPDPDLFAALERRGVPVIFGTLGGRDSVDARIARSGDDGDYVDLAALGVDILATDRPTAAFRALAAQDDPRDEIAACRGDAP